VPVKSTVDHAPHALGGVVLHVLHVGFDYRQCKMGHHLAQLRNTLFVGGDLGLDVVDVLYGVARRIFDLGQCGHQFLFAKSATVDQLEIVEQNTFLLDGGGVR